MLTFKELFCEGSSPRIRPQYRAAKSYPYVSLDSRGRVSQNDDDRLSQLLSDKPLVDDPDHHKLHALINDMEENDADKSLRIGTRGWKVSPIHAQLARIQLNGGTHMDMHRFHPNISLTSIDVYMNHIKAHLEQKQENDPPEERVTLPRRPHATLESQLPGNMRLRSFLKSPALRPDLEKLPVSEFFDKHLKAEFGGRWSEFPKDQDGNRHPVHEHAHSTISQVRRELGIKLSDEEIKARSRAGRAKALYGVNEL